VPFSVDSSRDQGNRLSRRCKLETQSIGQVLSMFGTPREIHQQSSNVPRSLTGFSSTAAALLVPRGNVQGAKWRSLGVLVNLPNIGQRFTFVICQRSALAACLIAE
jgi:hypothetical protein